MTGSQLLPGVRGPAPKVYRADTHRLIAPAETLTWVHPFLPRMGITRVANITGLDRLGIPVVQACRPNSRSLAGAQGKGLTLPEAKASALMESVEAYHAEHLTLPLKYGSYEDLRRGHRLVDVTELNARKRSLFHPHLPLLWVEGYDLLQEETVWVPYEMVHTNYTHPFPAGNGCFAATSNGLATGNHVLEAISHGISEVIERDAATLWGLAGKEAQHRTRIDPLTVEHPGCRTVLDTFARAGVLVGVWEMTSDVGVPSFLCKIMETTKSALGQLSHLGYGCHPSRAIALLRALTEAAQTRLTVIAGSRDDMSRRDYERSENPVGLRDDRAWFDVRGPMRHFSQGPGLDADSFDEDVVWQLNGLRAIGIQRVVVVDLTKPEFGIPVVRVIIPGLELAVVGPGTFALGRRARTFLERRS